MDRAGPGPATAPADRPCNQPYVSILCKFSDVAVEPKNLAFFQGMYASTFPGLDHYCKNFRIAR